MKQKLLLLFLLPYIHCSFGQTLSRVKGRILDYRTRVPLKGIHVRIQGTAHRQRSGTDGTFVFGGISPGNFSLHISADGYLSRAFPLDVTKNEDVDIGDIFLEQDISGEMSETLAIITDNELADDESGADVASGILQATRDIYLQRAAFDFSQAFFKVRGYDSREGVVMLNGIPMNKMFNGRPQWNNWGGLNDVTRSQELSFGLSPSPYHFGGVLGSTNIIIRASEYRPGFRISSSASNRFYNGRLMATYSSGMQENGLAYTLSTSRRWAGEAYMDGTLYDAWSFFGAVEYRFNEKNSIQVSGIYAPNRRGGSAAITGEVFDMAGRKYNPYWGMQDGDIRNSRERSIEEPVALLSYFHESDSFRFSAGASWQSGAYGRSRLGYYNAPNPDPVYYRYLPGFYINSPSGANFENAALAREGFYENPQIDWGALYRINSNPSQAGKSAYILYDDNSDETTLTFHTSALVRLGGSVTVNAGGVYKTSTSENYASISDLLGGDFHEDEDPFTDTRNDVNGEALKYKGDTFNYNYSIYAQQAQGFVQLRAERKKWNAFVAANFGYTGYQREGHFLNERFADNSFGKSDILKFSEYGIKAGGLYHITGRHALSIRGGYISRAPLLQNSFVNPRENNESVKDITTETIISGEISYLLRLPGLTAKLSGYYTGFEDVTDVNFFYVDAGVGSDFVQETVSGIQKRHVGGELGVSYQVSPEVKLTAVGAYGKFTYADNADVAINFDTSGREEDLINPDGFLDIGKASIKGYRLATGPQQAYSLGIEYRDPDYWWVGMTANYLADSYVDISKITRTDSFYVNPETGERFPDATDEAVSALLKQEKPDDFYLLNLTGGKSWLINGTYIGLFVSVNNVFDTVYRTGGYEQSRNGNFGQLSSDMARGVPSFGPKYWYGFGRTYFINLAVSF
ncbi:carboxypeptidase regulatory-like domain-containing protein [Sinomicrobium sp. M5D2P17]